MIGARLPPVVTGTAECVAEAEALFSGFHGLVTGTAVPDDPKKALGKLAIFAGVAEFPVRVKCATLAWHTLHDAMK